MEIIKKYFPEITVEQARQFAMLDELYHDWNAKINVISRKDIDNLYEHHVLHSLAIAKWMNIDSGQKLKVLDFGCGGGFPGVPLAIMFPQCHFTLIDGTGKKVRVAQEVANAIGLNNLTAIHRRGEEEKGRYDVVVSRAVMPLPDLVKIVRKNIAHSPHSGIICLKGGDLDEELAPFIKFQVSSFKFQVSKDEAHGSSFKVQGEGLQVVPISTWFEEEWFKEKNVVYLPL